MISIRMRRLGVLVVIALVGADALLGFGATPFGAAAPAAPLIVLARSTRNRNGIADVAVIRVLRGNLAEDQLSLTYRGRFNDGQLHVQRPTVGHVYLLLLSSPTQFFVEEWYFCGTVNVLEVIGERIANPKQFDPSWTGDGDLTITDIEKVLSREREN